MAISCTCSLATCMCKLKDTHTTACKFNSTEVTFHEVWLDRHSPFTTA